MRSLTSTLIAAAAATVAKTKAEEVLQPWAERVVPPPPATKMQLGADVAGHPENMPPSELADRVQHAVTGEQLTDQQRTAIAPSLHWTMGLGAGIAYGLLARRAPFVRAGGGTLAGAVLFAATHGSVLPAVKVQHPLRSMPASWWVWEAGSHVVYGVALDGTLRVTDRLLH